MENKLESVWSTEIDEYFEERFGIDIGKIICDEILKATKDENKQDKEELKWTSGDE